MKLAVYLLSLVLLISVCYSQYAGYGYVNQARPAVGYNDLTRAGVMAGQRQYAPRVHQRNPVRSSVKNMLERQPVAPKYDYSRYVPEQVYMQTAKDDITEHQIQDLCAQLQSYEGDSKSVSTDQFAEFLRAFGVDLDDAKIAKFYKKLNSNKSTDLNLKGFCDKREAKKTKKQTPLEQVNEVFEKLDKDGSGKLDRKEIKKEMLKRDFFNEEYLDQLLDQADKNDDNTIDFHEFLKISGIDR